MKIEIKLGQEVKDSVTGFVGIAVAKCIYLNGCVQFQLVPKFNPKSGILYRNLWVDETQLTKIGDGILPKKTEFGREIPEHYLGTVKRSTGGGIRSHPNE